MAVGDVNGDGKPDLVVPDGGSNSVSVLLGNGDGTFQAARSFPVGTNPVHVAVGDFNGDRVQDLAVANYFDFTVSVLLGNGDGTFQAARTFAASSYPWSVSVGDFNGDGKLDLATANFGSTTISVLLGNGDGTFQAAQNFGAGLGPAFVAVADFNGDGKQDLAVADYYSAGTVSVLINNTAHAPTTNALTVNKTGTGSGTVTSSESPPKIDCGPTCEASYGSGTMVTLTATPALGSTFTGWSGCDTASGTTCTVTMSAARSVTATFTLQRFTLTVSKAGIIGGGTVTSSDGGINCGPTCSASYGSGTVVTLTATPAFGSLFTGWSGCDAASGTTCTVTMSAARSVTATFTLQRFTLTVSKAGIIGGGTVTSSDGGINCGPTCSASYGSGTVVTLTATPAFGSLFTGWSGCDAVSGTTCTVTMSAARSVTASFLGIPPILPPLF